MDKSQPRFYVGEAAVLALSSGRHIVCLVDTEQEQNSTFGQISAHFQEKQ